MNIVLCAINILPKSFLSPALPYHKMLVFSCVIFGTYINDNKYCMAVQSGLDLQTNKEPDNGLHSHMGVYRSDVLCQLDFHLLFI